MKLSNLYSAQSLLLEMGAKKSCPVCGHPMTNYHFYRNGGWYCKSTSLQNPGPGADMAAVQAALKSGQAPRVSGSATPTTPTASSTPKTPATPRAQTQAAATPATPQDPMKARIQAWMTEHSIADSFTINDDNSVSVDGDAQFVDVRYKRLPVTFKSISGDCHLSGSSLESLIGLPTEIGGDFAMMGCSIQSMDGMPKVIKGDFNAAGDTTWATFANSGLEYVGGDMHLGDVALMDTKGFPAEIGGDLIMTNCKNLKSLEGMSQKIGGSVNFELAAKLDSLKGICQDIGGNLQLNRAALLTNLEGLGHVGGSFLLKACPRMASLKGIQSNINGSLDVSGCPLKTIDGFPHTINGDFSFDASHMDSLGGIHKVVKKVNGSLRVSGIASVKYDNNKAAYVLLGFNTSRILSLGLIKGVKSISDPTSNNFSKPIVQILNQMYSGDIDIHEAQEQLIDGGYGKIARI